MYTLSHDNNLLKEIDNNGGIFTSQEHASVVEKEFGETLWKSRENLLRGYLPDACWKSGGNSHGNGKRKDSGNYIPHKDFKNVKTRFLFKFDHGWKHENQVRQ